MYRPAFTVVDDEREARAMVAAARSGWFVTSSPEDGPVATLLPILWQGPKVIAHLAKANPQWRPIHDGDRALVIVGGPEAYVSPSWYPSKDEHGRVVPTWNYLAVHLAGPVRVHRDPEWLRRAVTDLTEHHERDRSPRWQVSDAPEAFIDSQLKAIVGIELFVERVEAKAKTSQNRPEQDRLGVIEGLASDRHQDASEMVRIMGRSAPPGSGS
jgi:transcriptional regulator